MIRYFVLTENQFRRLLYWVKSEDINFNNQPIMLFGEPVGMMSVD